eukprot:EG_transcript_23838
MEPPVTPIFIFNALQRAYADYVLSLFLEKAVPARICEVHRDNFLDHVDRCVREGMRYAVMIRPSHEKEKKVSFRAINLDGESPGVADVPAKVAVDYILHQAGKRAGASQAVVVDHKRKWDGEQDRLVRPAPTTTAATVDAEQMLLLMQQMMAALIKVQAQAQTPAPPALPALAAPKVGGPMQTPNAVQEVAPVPVQGGATGLQAMLQSAILRQQMSVGPEPQVEQPQSQSTPARPFNLASILSKLKK